MLFVSPTRHKYGCVRDPIAAPIENNPTSIGLSTTRLNITEFQQEFRNSLVVDKPIEVGNNAMKRAAWCLFRCSLKENSNIIECTQTGIVWASFHSNRAKQSRCGMNRMTGSKSHKPTALNTSKAQTEIRKGFA